ncbi:MAG TPA: hypothetical protein VM163_01605 [bacterium]|nr:hypothetical protein [bacterium]
MSEEEKDESKGAAESCGPECSCQRPASGRRMKFVICGIVLLVAVGVVAARLSVTGATEAQEGQANYSSTLDQVSEPKPGQASQTSSEWGALNSMAQLNTAAADTEAVFVVLPTEDDAEMARIEHELGEATIAVSSRGIRIKTFLLSDASQDYSRLAGRIGTPAIITMYKGRGSTVLSGDKISKAALLKAVVASSRPVSSGGCCGGGAAKSSCK